MNRKLIGIFVMTLLIATAFLVMGTVEKQIIEKNQNHEMNALNEEYICPLLHGSNSDLIENVYDDDTFCKDFKEYYSEGKNSYDEIAVNVKNNGYIPGTILLETTWHQSGLYAMKTPLENPFGDPDDPENHWRVGCWSTAIGQIINYHQLQSHGHTHYTCNGAFDANGDKVVIDNDLDDHTYNWHKMPAKLYLTSSQEEIDGVSTFLYDVSTVIQKDFGTGTYCIGHSKMITELQEHFEFISSETTWVSSPSTTRIEEEIDDFRPCMFYIRKQDQSGYHAVVIDGYKWQNNKFYVHINFGWDGSRDGWYDYSGPIYTYDDIYFRYTMFIRLSNYHPYVPCDPNPEDNSTSVPIYVDLSWTGGDPDIGDIVTYDVYFGTANPPPKIAGTIYDNFFDLGLLEYSTQYHWRIISCDNHGVCRESPIWSFATEIDPDNLPPEIPVISGSTNGKTDTEYEYTFVATDSDGHNVSYYIDWGDNTNELNGPYPSGQEIMVKHTWNEKGAYIIKVKAKDIYEAESDWATLEVSMPKNKTINTPFFNFLENHPHLFPLLRQLLDL